MKLYSTVIKTKNTGRGEVFRKSPDPYPDDKFQAVSKVLQNKIWSLLYLLFRAAKIMFYLRRKRIGCEKIWVAGLVYQMSWFLGGPWRRLLIKNFIHRAQYFGCAPLAPNGKNATHCYRESERTENLIGHYFCNKDKLWVFCIASAILIPRFLWRPKLKGIARNTIACRQQKC